MIMRYMPIPAVGMFDVLDDSGVKDVFILSQMMEQNEVYREFYLDRKWNTVIIDNALYEEPDPTPMETMIDHANNINADRTFIVAPEDLKSGMQTGAMTIKAVDQYGLKSNNWELMTILHEYPLEMRMQYAMLIDAGLIDIALGVSIFSFRKGYDRGTLASFCGIHNQHYLHAFGLDNLLEVFSLNNAGFDSVDSSMAFTAAVREVDIWDKFNISRIPGQNKIKRIGLTDTKFSQKHKNQALENIIALRRWCV